MGEVGENPGKVITTKEKLAIKAHFLAPWSNTQEAHVTNFARQLDRFQVKCEYHGITVTNDDKVDHFVAQMYACGLWVPPGDRTVQNGGGAEAVATRGGGGGGSGGAGFRSLREEIYPR